jgi:hypothetical protein
MQNNNPTRFYYNEEIEIKTKQGYDKKTYSKLVLNILKQRRIIPLFIPFGHLALGSLHVAHVHPCASMGTHV